MLVADLTAERSWQEVREDIRTNPGARAVELFEDRAKQTRRSIVTMIGAAGLGHVGGDLSVTDILTVLFNGVLNVRPSEPAWSERDRFILSKGHCAAALYSTLAGSGYFSKDALQTFMKPFAELNGHPNRNKVPGVETNTGPLGHGLPVAVGQAIGLKLVGSSARVFVVMGDGEMQEGSNWEALMAASHAGLDNLTAIVDRNRLQQGARVEDTNGLEPLPEKLAAFGAEVRDIDGHDYSELLNAFQPSTTGKPVAVIANTIKGRGVSFIEDRVEWHHKVPTPEQIRLALEELS